MKPRVVSTKAYVKQHCRRLLTCIIRSNDKNIINDLADTGRILFNYAVKNNSKVIVAYMIENGYNVNIKDEFGDPPLAIAINNNNNNNVEIAKMILDAGAIHCNAYYPFKQGPPHRAIYNNNLEMVKLLVNYGCDLRAVDYSNYSILDYIMLHQDYDIFEFVVKADPSILDRKYQRCNRSLLHCASKFPDSRMFKLMLDFGIPIGSLEDGLDPLCSYLYMFKNRAKYWMVNYPTFKSNSIETKKLMIRRKLAILYEFIDVMLAYGADINWKSVDQLTPLTIALEEVGKRAVIKFLLDRGANFDFNDAIIRKVLEKPDNDRLAILLIRHAVLCEARNRSDGPLNFDFFLLNSQRQNDCIKCVNELKLMKTTFAFGSMSLYKLLVDRVVGPYARNDRLAFAFEKSKFISRNFPIYKDILKRRFHEERDKLRLVPKAKKALSQLLKIQESAQPVVFDTIVYYLSKSDLNNLIKILKLFPSDL